MQFDILPESDDLIVVWLVYSTIGNSTMENIVVGANL